jgi:hypothetical protein
MAKRVVNCKKRKKLVGADANIPLYRPCYPFSCPGVYARTIGLRRKKYIFQKGIFERD